MLPNQRVAKLFQMGRKAFFKVAVFLIRLQNYCINYYYIANLKFLHNLFCEHLFGQISLWVTQKIPIKVGYKLKKVGKH